MELEDSLILHGLDLLGSKAKNVAKDLNGMLSKERGWQAN
jgi:hypothetical protein